MQAAQAVQAEIAAVPDVENFVVVPTTTLPNGAVVQSFRVAQYFAAKGPDGKAIVSASADPWVYVNYFDAHKACADAGFGLLTELQALAIAHDIANVAANWTGGAVGEGNLFQGLHDYTVDEAQPGNYTPDEANEQRWFTLSNGSRICDAAGNIYSWIFDDVQGNQDGIVARAFAADSPLITTAPYPSMERGVGWYPRAGADWSGYALVRGGCWSSGGYAGVFYLFSCHPDLGYDSVGFRCTLPAQDSGSGSVVAA